MFEKYNDNPAAICLGLYLLGCIFYVFQLIFMTETWLAGEGIGPEAIPVARVFFLHDHPSLRTRRPC